MKRIFMITAALLLFVLCGCQTNDKTDVTNYESNIAKAQQIAVVSSETSEVIQTIENKEDVEDFILALDLDNWTLKALPEDAAEAGRFVLSQEETVKYGQDGTDGTLKDIATITLYDDSYIRFEISESGMTFAANMTYEVSDDTANYLNGFFDR